MASFRLSVYVSIVASLLGDGQFLLAQTPTAARSSLEVFGGVASFATDGPSDVALTFGARAAIRLSGRFAAFGEVRTGRPETPTVECGPASCTSFRGPARMVLWAAGLERRWHRSAIDVTADLGLALQNAPDGFQSTGPIAGIGVEYSGFGRLRPRLRAGAYSGGGLDEGGPFLGLPHPVVSLGLRLEL